MQVQVVVYRGSSVGELGTRLAWPLSERFRLGAPFSFARNETQHHAFEDEIGAQGFWGMVYRDILGVPWTVSVTPTIRVDRLIARLTKLYSARQRRRAKPEHVSALLLQFPAMRVLQPHATLQQVGVKDGDVLGLMLREPPPLACMFPVPNSADLFAVIRSSDANPPSQIHPGMVRAGIEGLPVPPRPPRIWGALLYTEEDAELAIYIRKHFPSLHQLSGELFHIFVIETPPDDWRPAAGYWKARLQDTLDFFHTWLMMGWLSSKPYDKSQAYELARKLGVYPDQIPCLVLFDTVDRPNKLVFPIVDISPTFFRHLFSLLERSISPHITSPDAYVQIQQQYEAILRIVTASKTRLTEDNRQIYTCDGITIVTNTVDQRDQSVNVSNSTFGTFINQPRQDVHDFQNNFPGASKLDEDR